MGGPPRVGSPPTPHLSLSLGKPWQTPGSEGGAASSWRVRGTYPRATRGSGTARGSFGRERTPAGRGVAMKEQGGRGPAPAGLGFPTCSASGRAGGAPRAGPAARG